jgi:hypothetical protein
MTSRIHDSFVSFFCSDLFPSIRSWIQSLGPEYEAFLDVATLFPLVNVPVFNKVPDAAVDFLEHGRRTRWPRMIVEVGFSQTESELRRVAACWIFGTVGTVRSVLIVKFCQPGKTEDFYDCEKWEGWLEIWIPSESSEMQ